MIRVLSSGCLGLLMLLQSQTGSCDSADTRQHQQQERVANEANAQVGMPGVTRFTERRLMRQLYELRDQNVATFSYVPDMQGRLWHVCDSIGYGLPYGTQFTNPQYWAGTGITLPQPEPNGLFMPPTAEGTWVICVGEKDAIRPVYVEPRVIVSPFKLHAAGDWMEP